MVEMRRNGDSRWNLLVGWLVGCFVYIRHICIDYYATLNTPSNQNQNSNSTYSSLYLACFLVLGTRCNLSSVFFPHYLFLYFLSFCAISSAFSFLLSF
jgi:hypothetical protein